MVALRARLVCVPLLLLTLVVVSARTADAAASPAWRELGGSAHGGGLSQEPAPSVVMGSSAAIGPDGHSVVAYGGTASGVIAVKRWTGSSWESLSGPAGIGQGFSPQIRITDT